MAETQGMNKSGIGVGDFQAHLIVTERSGGSKLRGQAREVQREQLGSTDGG